MRIVGTLHTMMSRYRSIKDIASGFNLVDELKVSLDVLQLAAKQLVSVTAREGADRRIQQLQHVIDQLCQESMQPPAAAEQVASTDKTLQEVTQYATLVNTPQRAAESPLAAKMASCALEQMKVWLGGCHCKSAIRVLCCGCHLQICDGHLHSL